jgi:hypothetical protein
MAGSIYRNPGAQAQGSGDCHTFDRIDRHISISRTILCQLAGLKCNRHRHALAATWETEMDTQSQTQATGAAASGIMRELVVLGLHALAAGLAAAILAGLVVVVLTVITE